MHGDSMGIACASEKRHMLNWTHAWRFDMLSCKTKIPSNQKMIDPSLARMGWTPGLQRHLDGLPGSNGQPARVVGVRKNSFYVSRGAKEWLAAASGKLQLLGCDRRGKI